MGNGARAQQKRERNQKDQKVAKSQLKVNAQACDIQCQVCKSTFLKTTKAPAFVSPNPSTDSPESRDSSIANMGSPLVLVFSSTPRTSTARAWRNASRPSSSRARRPVLMA
ncbi:Fc.00g018770.m01.CDS01 [Cosmosporella sp. VM-42]